MKHHEPFQTDAGNLGCEKPEDLIVLCDACHDGFHRRVKRTSRREAVKAEKKQHRRVRGGLMGQQRREKLERIAKGIAANETSYPSGIL